MEKGNVLTISVIFIAIILTIFIFIMAVFLSHVNSTLYNFKLESYSIARSGIIAVNKNRTSIGDFNYTEKVYRKEFEELLKENYELDDEFSNDEKLISKIEIKEYKIYKEGQKDSFTDEKCDDITLHIVLEVKLCPIILKSMLEKIFTFEIHEDVNMNLVNM